MSGRNQTVQFSEVASIPSGSDPDFLFYNATVINNSTQTTSTANDPFINFQDTRSVPILKDKSKYAVSVENFTINGAGKILPLLIPQIRQYQANSTTVPNTNPNNTVYDLTLTWQYGGTQNAPTGVIQSTRTVQWQSENQATWTQKPTNPFTWPQQEIDYYFCYTYSHWVTLINSALACAWGDIQLAAASLSPPQKMGTKCPFFTYDDKTNLFSLWQDANTSVVPYGSTIGTPPATASPSNPPNPLSVYGSATTDASYQAGEYSFVGYNTNFEALLTNFNSTYYSDGVVYPPSRLVGISITTPNGNTSCSDALVIDAPFPATITVNDVTGITVDITQTYGTVTGTSWELIPETVTDFTTPAQIITVYTSKTFTTNLTASQSYFQVGHSLSVVANIGGGSFTGNITAFTGDQLTIYVTNVVVGTSSSKWTFTSAPLTSTTVQTIVNANTYTFGINETPEQSFLLQGSGVTVRGSVGSFIGDIAPTGFGQSLTYNNITPSTSAGTLDFTGSTTANVQTLFVSGVTDTNFSGTITGLVNGSGTFVSYTASTPTTGLLVITSVSDPFTNNSGVTIGSGGGNAATVNLVSNFVIGETVTITPYSGPNFTGLVTGLVGSAHGGNGSLILTTLTGTPTSGDTITDGNGNNANYDAFDPLLGFLPGETVTDTTRIHTNGIVITDNGSITSLNTIVAYNNITNMGNGLIPFTVGDTITGYSSGTTATITAITLPTVDITVTSHIGTPAASWTITPTLITSTSSIIPDHTPLIYVINLTATQISWLVVGNILRIIDIIAIPTTTVLYYPENVVDTNVPGSAAGSWNSCHVVSSAQLGSVFLSGTTPASPPYYVVVTQDFESTSSLWSPIATLVLATTFITVREEYTGTPITIGTGNLGGNATTPSFQKVLIETPIDNITAQVGWRGFFYYEPKVETLSNLSLSKDNLKNLDIQFYWRNRLTNSLTPLALYNGGSATTRLMFKRIRE